MGDAFLNDKTFLIFPPVSRLGVGFIVFLGGQNGGPTTTRKKFTGEPGVPFVQKNGIAGEFVVNTALQLTRSREA
jgi:hypothetical protein